MQCSLKWDGIFDTVNPGKILEPCFQANENLMKNACEEMRLEMEQKLWNISRLHFPSPIPHQTGST